MNIALLSYEYPPDTGFGGIGSYSYYHARALTKLGHRVHVFTGSTVPGVFNSEDDGVRITRIKEDGWFTRAVAPARAMNYFWFHNRLETAHAIYTAMRQALTHERFDIVEAPECGADAALVSMRLDVPLAIRFHSPARLIMDTYPVPALDRMLTGAVEQIAVNRADVRTACSAFLAGEVQQKMGVPAPVHVIPNGIDLALFDREERVDVAARAGVPADTVMVLFANRLEERKGIHVLGELAVPLLRQHRDVHLVLAGRDLFGYVEGTLLPRIRAAGLEGRFHVLGGLPLADVRSLVKRADIFLLPSLWENCPYSCIEAMAGSCAVVSSDCGGMPELIDDDKNGMLARTGSAASFIEHLDDLIGNPDLRARLGAAARRTVEERLTDVEIARRTVALYADFVATSSPRAGMANVPTATDLR